MIIISDNLDYLGEIDTKDKIVKIFEFDNFLIDDAKEIINESFIKENKKKLIVINSKNYTPLAQNSLLKILEEPPINVEFLLFARSKSNFLPTILSRLSVINLSKNKEMPLNFDIKRLNSAKILELLERYNALESKNEFDRFDLKNLISSILRECFKVGVKFDEFELEYINKLMILSELNTKSNAILTPLFLMILKKI